MNENKVALIKNLVRAFYPFAKQKLGFNKPVRLFLRNDIQNAVQPLGKTGFYDPEQMSITVFITGRHPKDIIKSISHELVHHRQNCDGKLLNIDSQNVTESGHLKDLEDEAYARGDQIFREFEDSYKAKQDLIMENKDMSEKNEKEYSGDISENDTVKEYYVTRADRIAERMNDTIAKKFGFKFNLDNNENTQKGGDEK